MSRPRRVAITGVGVLCSIAIGRQAFGLALHEGRCGVAPIRGFDTTGFLTHVGSEVGDFDPRAWIRNLDPEHLGRASQFAVVAARQAIEDARLDAEDLAAARCGVCVGTTDGEADLIERLDKEWVTQGGQVLSKATYARGIPAQHLSTTVAREFALRGEASTVANACSAGNSAIGHAFDLVRCGEVDFMLCGGADCISRKTFAAFSRGAAVASRICQPFSIDREGLIVAEGAGMLLLESLDSARAREARVYAEVLGYGMNCDGKHPSAPDRDSIALAIRHALDDAGVRPADVDYICAHGTGTKLNDVTETAAIRQVFGDSLPPISAIKSMIGHTMGAASALAAIACCLALDESFLPPTINFTAPDPECGTFDCVPNVARQAQLEVVMNNSFAVGGNNAILILGKDTWNEQGQETGRV